jgi:hypothetical protein
MRLLPSPWVCLSACKYSRTPERIFIKFNTGKFNETFVDTVLFWLKSDSSNDYILLLTTFFLLASRVHLVEYLSIFDIIRLDFYAY